MDEATKKLQDLFKKKVRNIKEKSALFFAKMEMKLKENNDDTLEISSMFRQWQQTIQGPTQKYDAQIFTLKSQMGHNETERETEFGLMRDVIKKLVYALEDKATTDVIANNQAFSNNAGYQTNNELSLYASPE